MPTNIILQMMKLGGPAIPSLLASMIASHVRCALSASTDIDGALNIFAPAADELPLAWRRAIGGAPLCTGAWRQALEI